MSTIRFWAPFGFLALAPLGAELGGAFTYLVVVALPAALLMFDGVLGDDPGSAGLAGDARHRLLPWLYIPLQLSVIGWGAWRVAQPSTPLIDAIGLTLSTGLTAGVFGFLAAHEMVHSRSRSERALGTVMLMGVLYPQFSISHLVGHHRHAATPEDPATARRGESAYAFLVRSIAGQAREAWAHETHRLARASRARFGLGNRMVAFAAIEAALMMGIGLVSWRALAFLLGQAALAIVLLELFNYIAHYGLMRRRDADGRLERFGPQHSWNTARRMNNASLFNMGRHSDHHRFSARPYHELEVVEGAALLPAGYAAAILTALIPPLWRKVMDPRVEAALGGPLGAPPAPPPQLPALARLTPRPRLITFPLDPRGRDRVNWLGAEGATAPETLRQKDRGVR